jgi:hypothetical protein
VLNQFRTVNTKSREQADLTVGYKETPASTVVNGGLASILGSWLKVNATIGESTNNSPTKDTVSFLQPYTSNTVPLTPKTLVLSNNDDGVSRVRMPLGLISRDDGGITGGNSGSSIVGSCTAVSNTPVANRKIGICSDGFYSNDVFSVDSVGNGTNTIGGGIVSDVVERDTVRPDSASASITKSGGIGAETLSLNVIGEGNTNLTYKVFEAGKLAYSLKQEKVPVTGNYVNNNLLGIIACGGVSYYAVVQLRDRAGNVSSETTSNTIISSACPVISYVDENGVTIYENYNPLLYGNYANAVAARVLRTGMSKYYENIDKCAKNVVNNLKSKEIGWRLLLLGGAVAFDVDYEQLPDYILQACYYKDAGSYGILEYERDPQLRYMSQYLRDNINEYIKPLKPLFDLAKEVRKWVGNVINDVVDVLKQILDFAKDNWPTIVAVVIGGIVDLVCYSFITGISVVATAISGGSGAPIAFGTWLASLSGCTALGASVITATEKFLQGLNGQDPDWGSFGDEFIINFWTGLLFGAAGASIGYFLKNGVKHVYIKGLSKLLKAESPLIPKFATNGISEASKYSGKSIKVVDNTGRSGVVEIPNTWTIEPALNNKGMRFINKTNGLEEIRIMDATPDYPTGYIRRLNAGGNYVDVSGNYPNQSNQEEVRLLTHLLIDTQ